MKTRLMIFSCVAIFLLNGCTSSPIDTKKKEVSRTENTVSRNSTTELTDKDIFGNETTLAVSEEDIQAALDGEKFSLPLNSAIILVQSAPASPRWLSPASGWQVASASMPRKNAMPDLSTRSRPAAQSMPAPAARLPTP